jgi:toxin ParE1/3/4
MILLASDAVEDVERLRDFLAKNSSGAAQRALEQIWTAIERLPEFPQMGSPTGVQGLRQLFVRLGAFGYVVRYTVLAETGDILITRIWHGREARE